METLKQVAERLAIESVSKNLPFSIVDFTNGYKLALERSYSQLDVVRILSKYETLSNEDFNKWFEQFKNRIR